MERKRGRPSLSESEKKRRRKSSRAKYKLCDVNIGHNIQRWNELREMKRLKTNQEVAAYLLDLAEKEIKIGSREEKSMMPSTSGPSTSTPFRQLRAFTATVSGISDSGETTSSATEQEIDITGVSGVAEIRSSSGEDKGVGEKVEKKEAPQPQEDEVSSKRSQRKKKLTGSFLNPFEISIDITHETEGSDLEEQDDSDFEPSLVFEEVLPDAINNESTDVAYEEMEFGLETAEEFEDENVDEETTTEGVKVVRESAACEWLVDETKVLVLLSQLKTLACMKISNCQQCNSHNIVIEESYTGSAIHFKWVCDAGHLTERWCSQPILNRRLNSGDFLISGTILTSGNNFGKMALWAKMLKLKFPSSNQYHRVQAHYLVPSIDRFWTQHQSDVIDSVQGQEVVVLGDGRNDSPGHSAQYCSYTLMDNNSKQILTLKTIDKRVTERKSAAMEKFGFSEAMKDLKDKNVNVVEVVTDAHMGIGALMKTQPYHDVKHSHDIWHVAKNLGKKITKIALKKGNSTLVSWTKDIVNHFWFVCKTAETHKEFVAMWTGVMHHIVNEHEWVIGHGDYSKNHCIHGPLQETDRNKQWLHPVKNSATLKDLARIVFDKRLLNQIDKYLNFRSTADLESFHQHILMYCAKRFAYSPPIYRVRNLLAALDHNLHLNRPNHLNKDGSLRLNRAWNKKSGRWTVCPIKQEKEFSYIPELLIVGLKARLEDRVGMKKGKALEASDPRRISAHLAPIPPESSKEIFEKQKSRFT